MKNREPNNGNVSKWPVRLALVEDNKFYARRLREVLEVEEGFFWAGSFRNAVRFLAELPQLNVDVVLLDVEMPRLSGVDCIAEIKRCKPDTEVIMISVHETDEFLTRAFMNGADGSLVEGTTPRHIVESIWATVKGGESMSPSVTRSFIRLFRRPVAQGEGYVCSYDPQLSPRENEILQHLADGMKYSEISKRLCISMDTVKSHIRKIYDKLGVRNRTEAVTAYLHR